MVAPIESGEVLDCGANVCGPIFLSNRVIRFLEYATVELLCDFHGFVGAVIVENYSVVEDATAPCKHIRKLLSVIPSCDEQANVRWQCTSPAWNRIFPESELRVLDCSSLLVL